MNVERAMRADGRFGGHIVMGHVDGTGVITSIRDAGDSLHFEIETTPDVSKYIVRKGSVTLDGVSLTVNDRRDNLFTVNIIPYTASKTTIRERKQRDKLNIETDIVGRYIESLMATGKEQGLDMKFLYEHGYIKGD